jgi:hypothetical protein
MVSAFVAHGCQADGDFLQRYQTASQWISVAALASGQLCLIKESFTTSDSVFRVELLN